MPSAREKILRKCVAKLRKIDFDTDECLEYAEEIVGFYLDNGLDNEFLEYAVQRKLIGKQVPGKGAFGHLVLEDPEWLDDVVTNAVYRTTKRTAHDFKGRVRKSWLRAAGRLVRVVVDAALERVMLTLIGVPLLLSLIAAGKYGVISTEDVSLMWNHISGLLANGK